ncbi:carboxymuconolactone decarboxylase family protein [Agrobacterium radiobacter]|jgi:AhpD family alkylhydroperoxidase|uniref:carboxymuconolactone decarboxylase family protein n=1 Tax=Agrobacterium radiobacter TaxID=362 RepID=UPI0007619ABA|nr:MULTISPECIES: carboxymuconolactone decarboxylase family protein [Agrobacterium tumefaciens complex]KAB0456399.1 carboxymuconolactone decarboxylase family protein [Agrobacterium tumefaciens]KWT79554.1 alkylhydroperoxidase [Agrobacterium radiobacter]MBB4408691.1 AhpD family alkylhydroperoxidase [Agrobacterium radiobacter]MBB4454386.1 AhpD family alkylhydroperoxidase [Agrobacterium radiobacter]NIB12670.1 carboxymuconolactone decarboxylase family protein [Agrobacterium radiobacter]
MTQRVNFAKESTDITKKFVEFVAATKESAVEESIRDLVNVRIAQLNNCTFCIDMHVKQAKIHGERELRLFHLAAWRESTLFAPRERAALAWAEVLTKLPDLGVSDDIYERVRTQLSEKEISDLTFVVMAANAWTRVNSGFKSVPGSSDAMLGLDSSGLK